MRSRAGYWIGGGLVVVGVVGAVLWFVGSLFRLDDEVDGFQRVPVPGAATVQLEARTYVVYYEGPNAEELAPAFEIGIVDAESGAPVTIERYANVLTYSFSGREGSAQATVTPPSPGAYAVSTAGDPGPGEASVALGRSIAGPLVWTILGAFAIGGVLVVSGAILIVVTAVRRSRRQ